jgi:microcystin-dependent protein
MAKTSRQTHKVFGGSGSSDNFAEFGSLVASTPLKTKDIATIQALAAWDEGFQSSIYGANKNLLLEDLNSFAFEHSTQIAYIFQMGIPEWDAATTYYKGSYVQRVSGSDGTGELYTSLVDNNVGNALPVQTDNANWRYMSAPPLPVGSSIDFMGVDLPVGFLWEDGTAYSRTTYATLFAAITKTLSGNTTLSSAVVTNIPDTSSLRAGFYMSGVGIPTGARILTVDGASQVTMTLPATATHTPSTICFAPHGVGDGSTTFNTPDTRRRVVVGSGGSASATLGSGVGSVGGEETHVLTEPEMPAHTHVTGMIDGSAFAGGSNGAMRDTQSGATGSTGGGGAHNNIQPSLVAMKIIKY